MTTPRLSPNRVPGLPAALAPAAALLLAAGSALATPQAIIRVLARTGQPAPGLAGLTFGDVSSPRLNPSGRVAFVATLAGAGITDANDSSIWLDDGSGPVLLLREAEAGPFAAPGSLGGVSLPLLNPAGDVALPAAHIAGPSLPTTLGFMVIDTAGARRAVALEGLPAIGIVPARNFEGFGVAAFAHNGSSAFAANRFGALSTGSEFGGGVWSERTGSLTLIAAQGDPAPGFAGGTFRWLESPVVNAPGFVLFRAMAAATGLTDDTNTGLWSDRSGVLDVVARAASQAPGAAAGVNFADFSLEPTLLDSGAAVFWSRLLGPGVDAGNDGALFLSDAAGTRLLLREGDPFTSLSGVRIATLSRSPSVAADGSLAVAASLTGAGVTAASNSCVLLIGAAGGSPALIAREGDQAPRLTAGLAFTTLGDPLLTESGTVALTARVATGVGPNVFSRAVVYAWRPYEGLVPLLLEGETVTIAGVPRVVRDIVLENIGLPGAGGSRDAVLVRARFTDGSAALLELRIGCLADYNADGVLDADDLSDFITDFFTRPPGGAATALDFDGSGAIDADDLSSFITRFFEGCT